jgi:hypothetical protein
MAELVAQMSPKTAEKMTLNMTFATYPPASVSAQPTFMGYPVEFREDAEYGKVYLVRKTHMKTYRV